MTKTKLVIGTALGLMLFTGVASAAYVRATILQYERGGVPCYKLAGLAGFLQAHHFISVATCNVDPTSGACTNTGSFCSLSSTGTGPGNAGVCWTQRAFTTRQGSTAYTCTCIPCSGTQPNGQPCPTQTQ